MYELCEYKNVGVLKHYVNSFSTNVEDKKARKKAEMIFACNFDRRKTKPLIYIKACIPSLLFGAELFSLTTITTLFGGFLVTNWLASEQEMLRDIVSLFSADLIQDQRN